MPTPTDQKSITDPIVGLTTKGRATVVLIRIRESWDSLTPDQRAEVADLVAQLAIAMRREEITQSVRISRPLPLVSHIAS
jgi:hypothetical protein